jgi:hypothetical protein
MKTTGTKKNLQLDKITGIRHDLGQKMTYVPVVKEKKFPYKTKSMKTTENTRQGNLKY